MYFELATFMTLVYIIRDEIHGKKTINYDLASLEKIQNECDLTTQPQCSSDCSSILVCVAGIEIPLMVIKCHPDSPFCDKGVCLTTPGSCSTTKNPSNFRCTSSGVFPEPTDCSRYHVCSKSGSLSTEYACPSGTIYNSILKLCQRDFPRLSFLSRKICEKINCDKVENDFVLFPTNEAFYAFCSVSDCGARKIFMYKCGNEETHIFDKKTRSCIFNCKTSGHFADSFDCTVYYICYGRRTFTVRRVNCPTGYYFNGTACINSTKHCSSGSVVGTSLGTTMRSSSPYSAEIATQVHHYEVTELSSEITSTQNYLSSTSSPTQTAVITPSTLPTYHLPYASILFLPCPFWLLQNERICLGTGQHLNYSKRSRT